jgi:hypothetical protein
MKGDSVATVRIHAVADSDDQELAELTQRLRTALLGLDVESVDPAVREGRQRGAKGVETLIGSLMITFTAPIVLKSVMGMISEWASRTGHTIEVTSGADTLKLTGVTSAQQERIIDDFLRRQNPSA